MSLTTRAIISLLAGLGAGLLGFWSVYETIQTGFGESPGFGWDEALLAGIFLPFIAGTLLVFQTVSRVPAPCAPSESR